MSNIIYVVPWAICDTDSVYVKKVASELVPPPEKGMPVDDWCIRDVIPNPDKRSKDIFAVLDVYNGYDGGKGKGLSVYSLNNSADKLAELGYSKAGESEMSHIKNKVFPKLRKIK